MGHGAPLWESVRTRTLGALRTPNTTDSITTAEGAARNSSHDTHRHHSTTTRKWEWANSGQSRGDADRSNVWEAQLQLDVKRPQSAAPCHQSIQRHGNGPGARLITTTTSCASTARVFASSCSSTVARSISSIDAAVTAFHNALLARRANACCGTLRKAATRSVTSRCTRCWRRIPIYESSKCVQSVSNTMLCTSKLLR